MAARSVTLVYCASGNRRFAELATEAGFVLGACLRRAGETVYGQPWFCDQDWKRPNRTGYMAGLARLRPVMASVLDWEYAPQLPEVLDWAEEAAQYVERVMLIPKVMGGISSLPRRIGGADVVLGYSVPTRYAGTPLPLWEFTGWPVHVLGGSPHAQLQCYAHLSGCAEVVSADGNYAQKMALRYGQHWTPGTATYARNRWWPTLTETDGEPWGDNMPYEAFRRSCAAIMAAWQAGA